MNSVNFTPQFGAYTPRLTSISTHSGRSPVTTDAPRSLESSVSFSPAALTQMPQPGLPGAETLVKTTASAIPQATPAPSTKSAAQPSKVTGPLGESIHMNGVNGPLMMEIQTPAAPQPSRFFQGLKKVALYAGAATLFGAGMATGGVGGLVCGVLAGAMFGGTTIGSMRPPGGGIGANSFLGPAAGAVAGGVLGAFGVPHGAAICGTAMAAIQSVRSYNNIHM